MNVDLLQWGVERVSKKVVVIALVLVFVLLPAIFFPFSAYSEDEDKVTAYRAIQFGMTTIEYAKAVLNDEKIHPSSIADSGVDESDWIDSDWNWFDVYVTTDFWVELGEAKYDLEAIFYGDKKHSIYNFKLGKLGELLFDGPLESYFNIDTVIEERDYLVEIITKRYEDPGETQEIEPIDLDEWEIKFSHIWYSEQTKQDKRIKIGIQHTKNFYFATMAIEDPNLIAKRGGSEADKEKEELESEAEDF